MKRLVSFVLSLVSILIASSAGAQVLGTFSWQMHPYCNVVTLTLTTTPSGYTIDGADNQCGAANQASAVGLASFNASGNVTLNFSIVLAPSARAVHVSAVVSPANGAGTWTDSVGNSGTFQFFGNVPGLPARPFPASGLPAGIITATELASNAITGTTVVNGSLTRVDLADAPRCVSAEAASVALTTGDMVVTQVTMVAPANSVILANATGYFYMIDGGTLDTARCSLSTNTSLDLTRMAYAREGTANSYYGLPFGLTRTFTVAGGSSTTVRLVCNRFSGSVMVESASLSALFVAQ